MYDDRFWDFYCDCDQHLGELDKSSETLEFDSEVNYMIEERKAGKLVIVCKCPYCGGVNYVMAKKVIKKSELE